jgi:hypothetical protein
MYVVVRQSVDVAPRAGLLAAATPSMTIKLRSNGSAADQENRLPGR